MKLGAVYSRGLGPPPSAPRGRIFPLGLKDLAPSLPGAPSSGSQTQTPQPCFQDPANLQVPASRIQASRI